MSEQESKRAEKDHAIAAAVRNALNLDDARSVERWLAAAMREMYYHRSRMTPEQLAEMEFFDDFHAGRAEGALPDGVRRKL